MILATCNSTGKLLVRLQEPKTAEGTDIMTWILNHGHYTTLCSGQHFCYLCEGPQFKSQPWDHLSLLRFAQCPPTWMLGYKFGLVYNDQWIMDGNGCLKCPWPHFRYICLEILNFLWSWGINSNYWQDEKVLNIKCSYNTLTCLVHITVADSDKKVKDSLSPGWYLHLGPSKCKPVVLSSQPWCSSSYIYYKCLMNFSP